MVLYRRSRALKLNMRYGIRGGKPIIVRGLYQRVGPSDETDKMSLLAARPYTPISVRTTYHGIPTPKRTMTPPGASRRAEKRPRFSGPKERASE